MMKKLKNGQVVEITVNDNGKFDDYPDDKNLKDLIDDPTQLIQIGRVVGQNKHFVLLQTCKADGGNNNDFYKVLKCGIVDIKVFSS